MDVLRGELNATKKQIEVQKEKLIKPLIFELKVCEEITNRAKAEYDKNLKELKMLNTIVRIPHMCEQFQRALRQREGEEQVQLMQR